MPLMPSFPFSPFVPFLPSTPFFPSAPSLPFSPEAPRSSVSATRSRHSSSAGYLHWIAVPLLRTSGSAALVFAVLPHPATKTMKSTKSIPVSSFSLFSSSFLRFAVRRQLKVIFHFKHGKQLMHNRNGKLPNINRADKSKHLCLFFFRYTIYSH